MTVTAAMTVALAALSLAGEAAGPPSNKDASCAVTVRDARRIMIAYDRDHDGKLGRAELRSLVRDRDRRVRQALDEHGASGGEDSLAKIAERDSDHDGYIDLGELAVLPTGDPGRTIACLR